MRAFGLLLAGALAVLVSATASHAAEAINNPDSSTVFLLQYKYSHTPVPYEAMAQRDSAVRSADEFHKPEAVKQAVARLEARAASLEGVKRIIVNLASTFSEYDTQYHEYDVNLSDGTYIPYNNASGRELRIALTNGTKAQTWPLNPQEAEDVLRKNNGSRDATLVLTLLLLPSPPAVDGEPVVLNAKIVGYDVLAQFGNAKLGSVVVERAP